MARIHNPCHKVHRLFYSSISAEKTCVPMVRHSSNVPVKLAGMVTVPSVPTKSE